MKIKIKSHPISLWLRPVANSRYVKLIPGIVLFLGVLGWATPLSLASGTSGAEPAIDIETKVSTQDPVQGGELTQGFSFLHSGYDLAVATGTRVYPVMAGKVIKAERGWSGYGNMILVDHENGYQSRYAHLLQIWVKEGQEVNLETTLGLSGSTGRSTGPHLHLEIMENGRVVNPKTVLGI